MKILQICFSATGNTAAISHRIAETFTSLGADVFESDITPAAARAAPISLAPYDAVVFGFPVHSWRAPRVVREWLSTLDGRTKPCSVFFTYGGFGIHPAHHSTRQILEGQGFSVVSTAEFPAPHTFNIGGWRAMEERPDGSDYEVADAYAAQTFRRFTGGDSCTVGYLEPTSHTEAFLDEIEAFRFRVLTQLPTRNGTVCCMCRACEERCPAGAMNAETGEADPAKCIACLACVAACPEEALQINDMSESWEFKLKAEQISEEQMKEKKSRIYL